jgi:hypothetical protein
MTAKTLTELSHREAPWRKARRGVAHHEPSRQPITNRAMKAYYGPMAKAAGTGKRIADPIARGIGMLLSMPEAEIDDLFETETRVDGKAAIAWLEGAGPDPWAE